MKGRILWLDNDLTYIMPYVAVLRDEGYAVTAVTTPLEAEAAINNSQFELLIVDAMIPTKTESEENLYNPAETDFGHKTGVVFYQRNQKRLTSAKTKVLVLTVRLDRDVANDFFQAGLPRDCFTTKLALRDVRTLSMKVESVLKH
jgi:Response regulator containing a CheY-like receiver domain and a GGDEF domain